VDDQSGRNEGVLGITIKNAEYANIKKRYLNDQAGDEKQKLDLGDGYSDLQERG
jgi:hypothetical protein